MKKHIRLIALALIFAMLMTNTCFAETSTEETIEIPLTVEDLGYTSLDDPDFIAGVEEAVYCKLAEELDPDEYFIEDISAVYISKEYLEEREYNLRSNVFFGYTMEELNATFEGTRYVFLPGEDGQTTVQNFNEIPDDTFNKIIKNVAIGTGVIVVCAVVAAATANPAAAVGAGKAIKAVFVLSSSAAKTATAFAVTTAAVSGASAAVVEGYQTGDLDGALLAGALAASEGYKIGAIAGAVTGIANGLTQLGDTVYFKEGTEQANRYPEGIRFTSKNGENYPRFEKYSIKTLKFEQPTIEGAKKGLALTGYQSHDTALANRLCGFKTTPAGYVWHHVEDMRTMILIPKDVHSMWHKGGASLIRKLL